MADTNAPAIETLTAEEREIYNISEAWAVAIVANDADAIGKQDPREASHEGGRYIPHEERSAPVNRH